MRNGQNVSNNWNSSNICIPNIGTVERRKRLKSGVAMFVLSLVVLTVLVLTGVDRLWRLLLVFLFWGAASGFFQWRDKT